MSSSMLEQKAEARRRARAAVRTLSPDRISDLSRVIRQKLQDHELWKKAGRVLLYAPLTREVDVWPLVELALAQGKETSLPYYVPEEGVYAARKLSANSFPLLPGKMGILEPSLECAPQPLNQLDLVLVPGVAFDRAGRRLGRGKGFYDRLLAQVSGAKCGVAFDEQLEAQLPSEPHDINLDLIVTPMLWLVANPSAVL